MRRDAMATQARDFSAAHRGAALRMAHDVLRRIDQVMYRDLIDQGRRDAIEAREARARAKDTPPRPGGARRP
jgi:hypothetical protein